MGTWYSPGHVSQVSLLVENGKIKALLDEGMDVPADCEVIDALGKTVMPGMIDSHNHMADPGPYNFREDWYCGSCSAASGGITTICDMPLPSEPATIDRPGFELEKGHCRAALRCGFCPVGRIDPLQHQGYEGNA